MGQFFLETELLGLLYVRFCNFRYFHFLVFEDMIFWFFSFSLLLFTHRDINEITKCTDEIFF